MKASAIYLALPTVRSEGLRARRGLGAPVHRGHADSRRRNGAGTSVPVIVQVEDKQTQPGVTIFTK